MHAVINEIIQVFHLAAWFAGVALFVLGPFAIVFWKVCDGIGTDIVQHQRDQGESSSYMVDPRSEYRAVADILDDCLTHRSKLQHYHRVLCQRAGVEPDSIGPMVDLITEAIFDGRRQNQCVYELEMKEAQHA